MTARFKKTAAVVVAFILVMLLVWQGVRKYPDIKADYLESARRAEIYDLSAVDKAKGFHAKMDTLMAFVHNNSVHNIDDEFWDDFRNKPRTLDKLLAHARGESTEKPHMECSTRSKLLLPLARKAGFEGHMVDMFKYHPEYLSHKVVEVKNPETGLWELYDPTYQIFWKNEKTGGRASIHDLVMEEGPFLPCMPKIVAGMVIKTMITRLILPLSNISLTPPGWITKGFPTKSSITRPGLT